MKIKAETGFGSGLAYRGPFVYRVDEDGGMSLRYHFSGKEDQHTDAIQTENLILRVMGIRVVNTGANHANGKIVANPSNIPSYR